MMEIEQGQGNETSPNAQRAADLIRDQVAVRWPAGHVEIALIQMQRRRQQRRYAAAGATLSVGGLALALVLGFGGYLRDRAPGGPLSSAPKSATSDPPSTTASARALSAPEPAPTIAEPTNPASPASIVASPVRIAAEAAAPVHEGHLLQQRLVQRREVAASRWVALADQKRFGEAYGLLRQVPMHDLSEPDDLLLAADVARQAGRPERAVPFLDRVVKEHPNEVCAQLAGFSLGKIYLDNLDQPALAARRFADVRAMAPAGGLAQDALAREVEAWARAGETGRARNGALEYVRVYPRGRRLAAVRDLGGI